MILVAICLLILVIAFVIHRGRTDRLNRNSSRPRVASQYELAT
jgi:hypothetical protein